MKFVHLAILGLVGESAALAMASNADECLKDAADQKCNSGAAFKVATGLQVPCAHAMRGQKAAAEQKSMYLANDNFGVWTEAAKQATGAGYICGWTGTAATDIAQGSKCGDVATATAGTQKAGYFIHQATGTPGPAATDTMVRNGNTMESPLYGVALCSQPTDVCDSGTAVMASKKTKTFAKAGEKATVTIKETLTSAVACSYLIEATCDAPYAQLQGAGASWDSTNQDKMTYTVAEWSDVSVASADRVTSAEAAKLVPASGGPAADFAAPAKLAVQLLPLPSGAGADPAKTYLPPNRGAVKEQGLMSAKDPLVAYQEFAAAAAVADVNPYFLLQAIAAKKAEYAAFAARKATYEAAKTAYNTALDAAEKLRKDTLSKDIFRLASPTDADKKILNAVPKVPQKPSPPAAYKGPALATKTSPAGLDNVVTATAATPASGLASGMGAWGLGQATDFDKAASKEFSVGKSWGTTGWGSNRNVAAKADGTDATGMTALGKTASKYLVEAGGISTATCVKHYMLVQASTADLAATISNAVSITLGVAEFAHTLEGPGAAPAALDDPKTPSTGAKMLGGLAAAAAMLTLY